MPEHFNTKLDFLKLTTDSLNMCLQCNSKVDERAMTTHWNFEKHLNKELKTDMFYKQGYCNFVKYHCSLCSTINFSWRYFQRHLLKDHNFIIYKNEIMKDIFLKKVIYRNV